MRVVFWGTPEFALPSLQALLGSDHTVVGVVTQPDRPAGRGRVNRPPAVKELAEAEGGGLPVLQPDKPQGPEFLEALRGLDPEVSVVAAYGEILRPEVLELPVRGSYNVHASLLPKLRGAAPVNWAIINGFERTGVTIMRMVEKLDAGPIVEQVSCEIAAGTTAGTLAERLATLGAEALLEALALIESGRATEREQREEETTYATKLRPDDVRIDWTRPAVELDRWIRGSDPSPGAWSEVYGTRLGMFAPRVSTKAAHGEPGSVETADERAGLEVATGSGLLAIDEVQPAGKRRMQVTEWIRGRGISVGARFT